MPVRTPFPYRPFLILTAIVTVALCWIPAAFSADLLLFAGAGLRQPTDKLIQIFEKKTGHTVRATYGGSGQLMSALLASVEGDLYMPGAFFYIKSLKEKGQIGSFRCVTAHTPVIGVHIHKADRIRSFDDLALPGIRLGLGDPKAMAFGRVARKIVSCSPLKAAILKNVVVYGATVKQLALYVAQGDVDAAIIGRADAFQFKDRIKIVDIPPGCVRPEIIAVAVLNRSKHPDTAARFRDFVASSRGVAAFELFGFLPLAAGTCPEGAP